MTTAFPCAALAFLAPLEGDGGGAALLWLAALTLLAAAAGAVGIWAIVARLDRLGALEKRLDALDDLRAGLATLLKERGDLDLRRIEHVLIETRDGQRRLEDAILRATQAALRQQTSGSDAALAADDPAQRIIARVVAQGFERVQLVPTSAEIERLLAAEGPQEVLLEARRAGVLCKGRVLLRDGAVTGVELSPAYTMFP